MNPAPITIDFRTPDITLRILATSLDENTVEQAENEIMRRRSLAGGPRLPIPCDQFGGRVEESEL